MASQGGSKAVLGCGCSLLFVAMCVTLFSAFHVFIDPRGAISRREAMPFFLIGIVVLLLSFAITGVGAFLASRKPKP